MAVKKCDDIVEQTTATEEAAQSTETIENPTPVQISENVYLGKNITAVESNVYDADGRLGVYPVTVFGRGSISETRPPDIADPLRAEARKFFALDKDGRAVYVNSDIKELGALKETKSNYTPSPISIAFGSLTAINIGLVNAFSQSVEITSDQFVSFDPQGNASGELQAWIAYCTGDVDGNPAILIDGTAFDRPSPIIITGSAFTDHFTKIVAPFTEEELELFLNNVNNPAYAKVNSKYNFFVPNYEDYISSGDIEEYYLENQFSNITRDGSALQQKLHDLGSDLRYVKNFVGTPTGISLTKLKNIGIPQESVSSIKKVTNTDDLYSMISTVELNTAETGKFGIAAEEASMTNDLLKHVMDQSIIYPNERISEAADNGLDFLVAVESLAFSNNQTLIDTSTQIRSIPLINIESWLQSYLNGNYIFDPNENFSRVATLLGIEAAAAQQSEECSEFLNTLKSLVLSGKINNIIQQNFRSYQEMIEGKEAYNETIIYEIKKVVPNDTNDLQTIFVPNTEELDILQYVDSQLKYDKEYKYEIYAHQLIIGTKYEYSDFTVSTATANPTARANCVVTYQPSLQIARIPIFSQNARVLDNAPVFPNVEIVPYKGVSNRLLINLDGNTGNYELDPIIITEEDSAFVEKYRSDRGLQPTDPITYKSDDVVSQFEIYRLSEAPQSYSDFENQILTTLSTPGVSSTSFIDTISPNTKYYYTFRSVDVHGNRSNPTEVFVVELVEFEGMIFFNQSVYEFGSETYNNVKTTRDFRRYLKINPNLIQSLINYDKLGEISSAYDVNSVDLGKAEESVWKKRFKMRITSKHSGKKFDINLNCKVNFSKDTSEPYTQQSGEQDPSKENKK